VDAMTLLLNFAMPLIFLGIFLISLWMHRKEKIIRLRGAIAAPLHGRWK
jgi:predicted branched-subunit amino acid permease